MYVILSVVLVIIFVLGIFVEYVASIRRRNLNNKHRKIVKLQFSLAKGQRLLNGRTILPLTVLSSTVCLIRTRDTLNALISIDPLEKRIETLADVNHKIENFLSLPQTLPYFYSRQTIPSLAEDIPRMLKQSMLLINVLKAEHAKGNLSVENLKSEVDQLELLIIRLKASIYKIKALIELDQKNYAKAQGFSDKAMELLNNILCSDGDVVALLEQEIESIHLLNSGILGVIEEKTHIFHDRFKGKNDEGNTLVNALNNDGLEGVFTKNIKY